MADKVMTVKEFKEILNGFYGTAQAIKLGYYPDHTPLADAFTCVVESLAYALDKHPREIMEIALRQCDYSPAEWTDRVKQIEEFTYDTTERMRKHLVGTVLDFQKDEDGAS